MAWGRFGDTVGLYPRLLAAAARDDAPDGAKAMVFGFCCLLAASSTAHTTDYVVGQGTIKEAGTEQWRWLLEASLGAGLLTKLRKKVNGEVTYKLLEDPAFLHIRLKAEIDWENQQRSDTENLRLSVPVRLRDGDLCRYCAVLVHWMGPTSTLSARKGTYDHLNPGKAATVDTLVVACLSCNSQLRDKNGEERKPLLPEPVRPFYGPTTAKWLTKNGRPTLPTKAEKDELDDADSDSASAEPRAASQARQRPAPADTARATAADSDPAPAGPRAATDTTKINSPPGDPPESRRLQSTHVVEESDPAGSGRDGSGSASGSTPAGTAAPAPRRRRSARGQTRERTVR